MKCDLMMVCGVAFAAGMLWAESPVVRPESVRLVQDDASKRVTVKYTLEEAPGIVTVDFLTNGVSIGEANFANVSGDVNRKVTTLGEHAIEWRPWEALWAQVGKTNVQMTARVTAWSPRTPPNYLVLGLDQDNDVRYFTSTNALPGGFASDDYRTKYLVMRKIPAAGVTWRMGAFNEQGNATWVAKREKPHLVTLSSDYFMAVFEMTQEQYQKVMGSNPSYRRGTETGENFLPVEQVSYNTIRGSGWPENGHQVTAGSVCDVLRQRTGMELDLPTDAQWEFACRAGTNTAINNGKMTSMENNDPDMAVVAWFKHNSDLHTHPVGLKPCNAWGLYDMHGNVYEWTLDWECFTLGPDLTGAPEIDPVGFTLATKAPGETQRGRRGGTFEHDAKVCRSAFRGSDVPGNVFPNTGIRLICPIDGRW